MNSKRKTTKRKTNRSEMERIYLRQIAEAHRNGQPTPQPSINAFKILGHKRVKTIQQAANKSLNSGGNKTEERGITKRRSGSKKSASSVSQAVRADVGSITKRLPTMSALEIYQLALNCEAIISDKGKPLSLRKQARAVKKSIELEWGNRPNASDSERRYFKWPSTEVQRSEKRLSKIDAPKEGVLSALGYSVGKSSNLSVQARRQILDAVFLKPLPKQLTVENLNEWVSPNSSGRLQKLAETIAALVRNTKHKNNDAYNIAIHDWEHDLNYLHQKYYVGYFSFAWPRVD